MKLTILNTVYTLSFFGMGIWECISSAWNSNVTMMNDMTRCFIITMAVFNFVMGFGSCYMVCLYYMAPESDRYALHISTGTSIWGLILYFRFSTMIIPVFQSILLAELIFFFTRLAVMIGISVYVCKPMISELENVTS